MEKVRATQLLPLRKKFKGEVEILSIKDKVAKKALEGLDIPGIKKLAEKLVGQCLFMFTNMTPFKLNVILGKNKVMLPARGGDTASKDVLIKAKNTGIPPGPILTDFKEAKIPTKIDQGTIWIMKDTVAVKKGEVISEKLATLLGKLDVKPVEAGISLYSALEDGHVFEKDELVVDIEKYRRDFLKAYQEAASLSIESAYVAPDNIKQILARAARSSHSVATKSGYLTDDNRLEILQRANASAHALVRTAKDYKPS